MKSLLLPLAACFVTTAGFAQAKSTMALLQGKWQSTADKTNFLIFEQTQRREIAGGSKQWDSETFVLANTCQNESDKNQQTPEKDRYISVPGSNLCWYIVSVTTTQLTLSYMGRGNTLSYRRVAVGKKPAQHSAK